MTKSEKPQKDNLASLRKSLTDQQKALNYNNYLAVRFMKALYEIATVTKRPYEIPMNEWLQTLDKCIDTAKEALTTKSFEKFNKDNEITQL